MADDDAILSKAEAIRAQRQKAEGDAELAFCQEFFDAIGAKLSGDKDYEVGKVVRVPEVEDSSWERLDVLRHSPPAERYVCRMRVPAGNSSNLNVMLAFGRRDDTCETDEWLVLKHEVDVDAPIGGKAPEKPRLHASMRDQDHLAEVYENQQSFAPRQIMFLDLLEPAHFRGYIGAYMAEEIVDEVWEETKGKLRPGEAQTVKREVRVVYSLGPN